MSGIPTQIPQSDVIIGWMKHEAFQLFPDSLRFFAQSKYALYHHSMLETCLTV